MARLAQLEQAYRAALAEGGEEAGQRALGSVARRIADRTDAIRYERSLQPYFPEAPNTPLKPDNVRLRFKLPAKAATTVAVSESVRAVILALSRYVSPVPGGIPSLLATCCAMSDAETYRLLGISPSNEEALIEAIKTSPIPPELKEKLARAIRHVAERNRPSCSNGSPPHMPLRRRLHRKSSATPKSTRYRATSPRRRCVTTGWATQPTGWWPRPRMPRGGPAAAPRMPAARPLIG